MNVLQAADPGERRVAIIALGHSGDPAAVGHLSGMVADPDAGVRQQVALALGRIRRSGMRQRPWQDCWSIRSRLSHRRRLTAWLNSRIRHAPTRYFHWSNTGMPSCAWARLRALKELRRKDTLKPALEALQG